MFVTKTCMLASQPDEIASILLVNLDHNGGNSVHDVSLVTLRARCLEDGNNAAQWAWNGVPHELRQLVDRSETVARIHVVEQAEGICVEAASP